MKTPPATPPRKASPPRPPKNPDFVPSADTTSHAEVVVDPVAKRPKFAKGNQLWQMVKNVGIPAIISDAGELWQTAISYFNWCDQNPQSKAELVKYLGDATECDVPLGRPYSMNALTIFAGVSGSYFRTRKSELGDKIDTGTASDSEVALLETILLIEDVVRTQRFEGAAVGIFKENLISRVDGYADNINQNNTGEIRQNIVVRDSATAGNLKKLDDLLK